MDYVVYDWIKELGVKKLYDVNVFAYLYKYVADNGHYNKGVKFLAKELNISERSTYDSLKRLVKNKVVKRELVYKDNLRTHSKYFINAEYINTKIQYAYSAVTNTTKNDNITLYGDDVSNSNVNSSNLDDSILCIKLSNNRIKSDSELIKYKGYTLGELTWEYAKNMFTQNKQIQSFISLMILYYNYLDTKTAKYKPRGILRVSEILKLLKSLDTNSRIKFIMQIIVLKQQTITAKNIGKCRKMTTEQQAQYDKLYSKYYTGIFE